ncbi:MAG: phenylacetate--CoA ligase family protein, partial [Pseudomonadota bacterium]|nr:phenylacetate--CoA ligase family protein [Pseudomonadota bacterium]
YETCSAGAVEPGMVVAEEILLEIVTPGTGDPVQPGQVGEVVVTSFNPDYPLIRFATGDLSAALPAALPARGSTAHTNHRISGWKGRADQSAKVRGMFVHPAQVAQVVRRFSAVLRARLLIEGEPGADTMTLHCEVNEFNEAAGGIPDGAALVAAISQAIREETALRGEAVLVAPDSLPNDGKVIDDLRRHS